MCRLIVGLILVSFIYSCAPNSVARMVLSGTKPKSSFSPPKEPVELSYENTHNWLKLPENKNEYEVDVFFIHPTTYISSKSWNMPTDDSVAIKWALEVPVVTEASVFEDAANIYVPKYRQATLYSFVDQKDNGEKALEFAYQDVRSAFYYYLEHYNNGKPFFIASHSQGSYHTLLLLKEIMNDETIKDKLITAYAVGWPVYESYLYKNPQIKVCEDSLQTGCVVSWNTQRGALYSLVKEPAISVNPLNWKTTEEYVPKEENIGAKLFYYNGTIEIPNYVGAQNKNGVLIIDRPIGKRDLDMPLKAGNYHVYDYSFFYYNIKENVNQRIRSYNNKSLANK